MYLARTCRAKSLSLIAQHAQHAQCCVQMLSMHIAFEQGTACTALSARANHAQHTALPCSPQHAR